MRLLGYLFDILFPPRDTEVLVQGATRAQVLSLMRPVTRTIDGHRLTALLPYRVPLIRALVLEAKFKRNAHAITLLGAALHVYLEGKRSSMVLPIPLGRRRHQERGYNQVEEIAKAAGITPVTTILIRAHDTLPQTGLSGRARRRNMHEVFSAEAGDPIHTYIVLDDVTTTGATLRDAGRALHDAGARHIEFIALAH